MKEKLLHFVWKYRPFYISGRCNTQNEVVNIIDPGFQNIDAGPDFFNAKIRIGTTVWVGNVEIHLKSSDWYAHGHQSDSHYDNVILHVVVNDDKPAINSQGHSIATLVVDYPYGLESSLDALLSSTGWIPCHGSISVLNSFSITAMLQRLMVDRLEQKTEHVLESVSNCNGSWEEAFYRSMAYCFGLKVNAYPAELLAKSLPLNVLGKHRNSLFQIEALLFGQAGMLSLLQIEEPYFISLQKEYGFLAQKFALAPIDGGLWKFLRMRPVGFPMVRLAQLAALINRSTSLFSKVIEAETCAQIDDLLNCQPSEFWLTHYNFQKQSAPKAKPVGKTLKQIIIINSVVPFMFAYGISRNDELLKNRALQFLDDLPVEDNATVNGFKSMGIKLRSAADSQALIQLKTGWCDAKKCIFCDIGAKLLAKSKLY